MRVGAPLSLLLLWTISPLFVFWLLPLNLSFASHAFHFSIVIVRGCFTAILHLVFPAVVWPHERVCVCAFLSLPLFVLCEMAAGYGYEKYSKFQPEQLSVGLGIVELKSNDMANIDTQTEATKNRNDSSNSTTASSTTKLDSTSKDERGRKIIATGKNFG